MKKGHIKYSFIFLISLITKPCNGMDILATYAFKSLPVLAPGAIYVFLAIRHRLGIGRQIQQVGEDIRELKEETHDNFRKTRKDIKTTKGILSKKIDKGKKVIVGQIDDSERRVCTKIEEAKNELSHKIDESRITLETLINRKIDESEENIIAHIGTTRRDILINIDEVKSELQVIKDSFERKLNTINEKLKTCAKLEDIQNLEKRLVNTVELMMNTLGGMERRIKNHVTKEITESENKQKQFITSQMEQQERKSKERYDILCQKYDSMTSNLEQILQKVMKGDENNKQYYENLHQKNGEIKTLIEAKNNAIDEMKQEVDKLHQEFSEIKQLLKEVATKKKNKVLKRS